MSRVVLLGPSLAGAAAAALIGGLGGRPICDDIDVVGGSYRKPPRLAAFDHGPITDSTKESKRAKRRRLAKEAS